VIDTIDPRLKGGQRERGDGRLVLGKHLYGIIDSGEGAYGLLLSGLKVFGGPGDDWDFTVPRVLIATEKSSKGRLAPGIKS